MNSEKQILPSSSKSIPGEKRQIIKALFRVGCPAKKCSEHEQMISVWSPWFRTWLDWSLSLSLFLSLTLSIFETLYIHTLPLSLSLSIHCLMSTCVSDMLVSALRWTRRTKGTFQGRVISKAKLFTWLTLTNRNKPQYPSAKQSHSFTLYSDLFRRHLPMDLPIHPVDIELWKNCPATVKEALDGFLRPLA